MPPDGERAAKVKRVLRGAFLLVSIAAVGLLAGCGGGSNGGDTGASELARQQELSEARHQAAQDARQAQRIKDLERQVHHVSHQQSTGRVEAPVSDPPEPTAEQAPVTDPGPGDWPGGSDFTAILASVSSEEEARSIQAEASSRGLDAGVLYSGDYSSLRPGYWVVFSGAFPSADGAESRAAHAQELGYSEAYPRFVAP